MYDKLQLSLPAAVDRKAVLECLDRVLDPELDESILELGFVESLEVEHGQLTVDLRLPTYWCAPNFTFLMADDVRRELLSVENVETVTVRLLDHFASEAVADAVNAGRSFPEAFPDEAFENLTQLRALFLRKGFIKRLDLLLQELRGAGLSLEEITRLKVEDVRIEGDGWDVRRDDGGARRIRIGAAKVVQRYLERRGELGIDRSPASALVTDLRGDSLSAEELEKYRVRARTVRVALDANGALCSTLLRARQAETKRCDDDQQQG